ncbi:MAG: hypothetical protein WBM00_08380 [Solirubrobacterales bacterium]
MQFEFAGLLVADGSYLVRDADGQRVLVVETLDGPSRPPRRRRRKPRPVEPGAQSAVPPLTRATIVQASDPFESSGAAAGWLDATLSSEGATDGLIAAGLATLNRALHAEAAARADPRLPEVATDQAIAVRIGYGSGEEVTHGRFSVARQVDVSARGGPRRRRTSELHSQERLAAVLAGREQIDACETLVLRARADLDCGRSREAALQLRIALETLLAELGEMLPDSGHREDIGKLETGRKDAVAAAAMALRGDLDAVSAQKIRELTELCERVLRRRRLKRG